MKSAAFSSERAFATVDTAALLHNFRLLKGLVAPDAPVMAVVKADAYGHGVFAVVPPLAAAGCTCFAVATLSEALEVRKLTEAAILILGYTPPARAPVLAGHRLMQTVFSLEYAKALSAVARQSGCRVRVQIKLDGGLCRVGLDASNAEDALAVCRLQGLEACGLFTHFPCPDTDPDGTAEAIKRLDVCRAALAQKGFALPCHAAASGAALAYPQGHFHALRLGLSLYGIAPCTTTLPLRPVLSLYAPVVQIRAVPSGTPVGYGGDFVTARPTRIGTLPIGYADGFCRRLSGFSVTLLHAGRCFSAPVVGRISMDQLTLDLTDTPAAVGDLVRLWSSATQPASYLQTIPYEVLTALSRRVRRIVIR